MQRQELPENFWTAPVDEGVRESLNEIVQKDLRSRWGRVFMANEFLMKSAIGMLGSTLWLFLISNPAKVSMERSQNLPVYLLSIVVFTIVHILVQFLCSVVAKSSY